MALQVMAPQSGGIGAGIKTPKFSMSTPEFRNFGEAPKIVNAVGEATDGFMKSFFAYQQKKQKMRDEEDLSAALSDLQKQAVEFQSNWKGTHFGTEARDAGKIFSQHVDETAIKMIDERFKGRPELAAAFRSRAAQVSFSGFSHGAQYDDQQDLQYRKSALEGMKADILSAVATGSDDDIARSVEGYMAARGTFFPGMNFADDDIKIGRSVSMGRFQRSMNEDNYEAAWGHMNEGMAAGVLTPDDVAKMRGLMENRYVEHANMLYAQGRTEEGDALVAKVESSGGKTPTGIITTRGVAHSSADRNNPFGIGGKAGYKKYETPEDGVRDADRLLRVYIDGRLSGHKGEKLDTISKIITTWAPPHENNTKKYIADASRMVGIDANTPIDYRTPEGRKNLDKLISSMAMLETSWKITPEQVEACRGGGPDRRISETTRLKLDGLKMKGSAIGVANDIAGQILGEGSDYLKATHEERVIAADALLSNVPEEIRPQVTARVNSRLMQFKRVQDAEALNQRRQYVQYAKQQGWTPQQAADQVDLAENLNPTAKEWLKKFYKGEVNKPTPENKKAYGELLRMIDLGAENGGIDKYDDVEIDSRCQAMGLTDTQAAAVKKYASEGGAAGKLKTSLFDAAYKKLHPNATSDQVAKARGNMFDLVTEHFVDPGKLFTLDSVARSISLLETQGEDSGRWGFGNGRDSTYADYLRSDAGGKFYPEISDQDKSRITERLTALGVKDITPEKITEYYFRERGGK